MEIQWSKIIAQITKNHPNGHLGQNFLTNYSIVESILQKVSLEDNVLEIGPGSGILSYGLLMNLKKGSSLTLVEKDKNFIDHLNDFLHPIATERSINLTIINGDGLEYIPSKPVQVIANIPYNISSQLFFLWLKKPQLFSSLVVMVQKEFGEKLWKNYKINKKYSTLSVLAQGLGTIEKIMDLSPASFYPAPSVYSQVIYYKTKPIEDLSIHNLLMLLNESFSCPRKQLKNNVQSPMFLDFMATNQWGSLRPENISPLEYIQWVLSTKETPKDKN
jgi:16S rRNA (adenine1518-N6/adenine1519-N6)-dimethyltransferase